MQCILIDASQSNAWPLENAAIICFETSMRLRLLKWIMKEAQAIKGDEVARATASDEPAELVRASQIVNTDVRHLEMQPSNGKKEE
jgi:hypothetical protein